MADVNLTTTQQVPISVVAVDSRGNDATPQFSGRVEWSADNPALVNLANGANSLAVDAVSLGIPGIVNVTAIGRDARGQQWTAVLSLEIVEAQPEVASFSLAAGTPVEQS